MAGGSPENPIPLKREPKMRAYYPEWWHHNGAKMKISELEQDQTNKRLVIKNNAAEVVITREDTSSQKKRWTVDYRIIHASDTWSSGRTTMNERELTAAFSVNNTDQGEGESLLDRYGGDSASQSTYIRYKRFLNIPGPGTDHDGDPNVSIEIDDSIKLGVSRLLFG